MIPNTIIASETARKIHAPTPCTRKKSGMPSNVNVLNSVAAKVKKPKNAPRFEPAMK